MFAYAVKSYAEPDYLLDDNGKNVTIWGFGAVAVVGVVSLLGGFALMALQWSRDATFFRGRTLRTGSFEDLQRWRAEGTQYGVIGGDVTITQEGDLVTDGGLSGLPTEHARATSEGETR